MARIRGKQLRDGEITNAKQADMANGRIKARVTAGSGPPEDATGTQVTALLDAFVGTSGTPAKGQVPAPSSGDDLKVLRATGGWAYPMSNVGAQRRLRPILPTLGSGLLITANRIYALYLGFYLEPKVISFVDVPLNIAGSSTQTVAAVGLGSTPLAPNGSGQTVSVLTADGTMSDLTTGAPKLARNTSPFDGSGYSMTPGTDGIHLWALGQWDMAATEPTFLAAGLDLGNRAALIADGAGSLVSLVGSTFSGVANTGAGLTGAISPLMVASMD